LNVVLAENEIDGSGNVAISTERVIGFYAKGNAVSGRFNYGARSSDGFDVQYYGNKLTGGAYGLSIEAGTTFPFLSVVAADNFISGSQCDVRVIVDLPIQNCNLSGNDLEHETKCLIGTSCR
jgi:hypothetical protein